MGGKAAAAAAVTRTGFKNGQSAALFSEFGLSHILLVCSFGLILNALHLTRF